MLIFLHILIVNLFYHFDNLKNDIIRTLLRTNVLQNPIRTHNLRLKLSFIELVCRLFVINVQ